MSKGITGSVFRLYRRQHHLLALLQVFGGQTGKMDFQKLLFLYCQDLTVSPYDFVPYKYGAFSFNSQADCRRLIQHGLLTEQGICWRLTPRGKTFAHKADNNVTQTFACSYRGLRGDALIAETYRRYPYYAIHSKIAERVLHGDRNALNRIKAAVPDKKTALLLTIGYEGRTLENYLNLLIQAGVTILCDVRRNAISRKYGFSQTTLAHACQGVDIQYEHLPELGIESGKRQGLDTQADYQALFTEYARTLVPQQATSLQIIRNWLESGESVALTCYERIATQCHRKRIATVLERMRAHEVGLSEQVAGHATTIHIK